MKNKLHSLVNTILDSEIWSRVFKNFSIGLTGSLLTLSLALVKTAILTKYLLIEQYGLIMIVINFYAFFNIILDIKINDIIFRYFPFFEKKDKKGLEGILNLCLILVTVIIILTIITILLTSSLISNLIYGEPNLETLLLIYLIAGAGNILNGYSLGILRLKDKFKQIVIPQVIGSFLTVLGLVVYILILKENNLNIIISILAAGSILSVMIPFIYANKLTKEYRSGYGFIESIKSLKKYRDSIVSMIIQTNISSYFKLGSFPGGAFLLGVFSNPTQVALYNVAFQLIRPLEVLQNNIQPAIYPEIVHLHSERKWNKLTDFIKKITVTNFILGNVAIILSYFLIEPIILAFTTKEYLNAISIFYVLIGCVFLTFLSLCFYPLAVVMDELKRRNIVMSFKIIYIAISIPIGLNALNIAFAQLLGELTVSLFQDLPLYKKLKTNN